MLLGKIIFSNNFLLQGQLLYVDNRVINKINDIVGPELKKCFVLVKDSFYYHIKEIIKKISTPNKIDRYEISYQIIVFLNFNKKWYIDVEKKEINIVEVDVLRGECDD